MTLKKFFFTLAVISFTASVNAQIVSSNSRNVESEPGTYPDYNRLSAYYQSFKLSANGMETNSVGGVQLEYLHGFNVVKTQPLYIETGLSVSYDDGDTKTLEIGKVKAVRINIPASLAYKYTLPSVEGLWVQPYAGLDLIGNPYLYARGETLEGEGVKRIQGGWHAGVNLGYKKINIGIKYSSDFTDMNIVESGSYYKSEAYHVKSSTFSIGVGINF